MSIIPTSAIEQQLQSSNSFTLTSLPAHLTSQCQSTSIVTTPSTTSTEMQQQINSFDEVQQQEKIVFSDKNSPPLQLIFQLPPVPQGTQTQQLSQPTTIISPQTQQHLITSTQNIAQTQTGGLQLQQNTPQNSNLIHQNNINIQQQQIVNQQAQLNHCNQHSQV